MIEETEAKDEPIFIEVNNNNPPKTETFLTFRWLLKQGIFQKNKHTHSVRVKVFIRETLKDILARVYQSLIEQDKNMEYITYTCLAFHSRGDDTIFSCANTTIRVLSSSYGHQRIIPNEINVIYSKVKQPFLKTLGKEVSKMCRE
jgi:hypothetical protein